MSPTEIVRDLFDAYMAQDRARAEELIADDFRFTSPQDDRIDRTAYFERCFPTVHRVTSQKIVSLVSDGADGVFLLYEYALRTGERHRNTEFLTVRGGKITDVQVFFGGRA